MTRRTIRLLITLALGLLVAPRAADAQPPGKLPRVGILTAVTAPTAELCHALLRQRLRELGYVEGQHIVLESRSAEEQYERLPALAAQLVALPVDILVTWGTPAAVAAKQATSTVPIIVLAVGDPVGSGIVASLARPGGNVTGVTNLSAELSAKLLALLKEVVPGLTQIAVLRNPRNPASAPQLQWTELAAQSLGVAACKQWHQNPQTRGIFGSHSAPTSGRLGSQSPPISPHSVPTACKQLAEPTFAANLRYPSLQGS